MTATFTKEQLKSYSTLKLERSDLAAFALAQMEAREKAEAERDEAAALVVTSRGEAHMATLSKERYMEERDLLAKELAEAMRHFTIADEERLRLRVELAEWKAKSDRHESERDSFRMANDRLAKELAEAEEAILRLADIADFFNIDSREDEKRFFDPDDERGVPGHWTVDVDPAENEGHPRSWAGAEAPRVMRLPAVLRARERGKG